MIRNFGRMLLLLLLSASLAFAGAGPNSKGKPTSIFVKTTSTKKKSFRKHFYERFYTSSFDSANIIGDVTTGEDPAIRAAAVEEIGRAHV